MDMRLWDRNRLLTALAGSALLLVLVYWTWAFAAPQDSIAGARVQLAAPRPHPVDPALSAPLVSLMSPGAVQPQVQVLGVLAGDRAPLALLSVNGALPQAVAVGERLGPATVIRAISAETVTLEQAGQTNPLPVPGLPPLPEQGIVPAR